MNYQQIKVFILIFCSLFLSFCNNDKSRDDKKEDLVKFLQTAETEWIRELQKFGFDNERKLENTVLLVTHSTHCPNCLNELSEWNKINQKEDKGFKIILVVIERHTSRYDNFLSRNNLSIQSFQDSSASVIKNEFIPHTPVKIYFNPSGSAKRMHIIGADPSFDDFLKEIQSHNNGLSFLDSYYNEVVESGNP